MTHRYLGFYLLAVLLLLFYWFPIVWWVGNLLIGRGVYLPPGLPLWSLIGRTVTLSLMSSVLSVLVAYPGVLLWRLSGSPARRLVLALMVLPLLMGLLSRNYSWIGLLSNRGIIGSVGSTLLGEDFLYSRTAVVVVMASVFMPISFFILVQGTALIRKIQIDAAKTLGAPDWRIVFSVVLPLTRRAAALAIGFTFALAVGFFVTPRMLGGGKYDFVGNAILMYVDLGLFNAASTVSIIFLAVGLLPAIGIAWYSMRRRRLVSGR